MFSFLKQKPKSPLYKKDSVERMNFYQEMIQLRNINESIFIERYWSLTSEERVEFSNYIVRDTELKKSMLQMIDVIKELLKNKHKK